MNQPAAEWVWLARIRKPQGRKGEVFAEILTDFPEKFAERKHLWLLRDDSRSGPVTGHDFSPADEVDALKGHGFSRAVDRATSIRPLGPEGRFPEASEPIAPSSAAPSSPASRPVELIHHWLHKGGIVLHFAGVDSITAAEALAGLVVAIPQSERAALAADEVYIADLIGCELVDVAGDAPSSIGRIQNVDRTAGPVPLLIVQSAHGEMLVPFAKSYLRKVDVENARIEMALPEGLTDL
jgi:16S rRNA processing protein RimM